MKILSRGSGHRKNNGISDITESKLAAGEYLESSGYVPESDLSDSISISAPQLWEDDLYALDVPDNSGSPSSSSPSPATDSNSDAAFAADYLDSKVQNAGSWDEPGSLTGFGTLPLQSDQASSLEPLTLESKDVQARYNAVSNGILSTSYDDATSSASPSSSEPMVEVNAGIEPDANAEAGAGATDVPEVPENTTLDSGAGLQSGDTQAQDASSGKVADDAESQPVDNATSRPSDNAASQAAEDAANKPQSYEDDILASDDIPQTHEEIPVSDLSKLTRMQLLQLLRDVVYENQQLRRRLVETQKELDSSRKLAEESQSLSEAYSRLSALLNEAQTAMSQNGGSNVPGVGGASKDVELVGSHVAQTEAGDQQREGKKKKKEGKR